MVVKRGDRERLMKIQEEHLKRCELSADVFNAAELGTISRTDLEQLERLCQSGM